MLNNLYINPQNSAKSADGSHLTNVSDEEMQEHYDNFFEDVFVEAEDKYGEVEEMNVCDNLGDHLVGNVYIKFRREEDAARAVAELNNRWFGGRPIYAELSPVTDFREACCRMYFLLNLFPFSRVFCCLQYNFRLFNDLLFLFFRSVRNGRMCTIWIL